MLIKKQELNLNLKGYYMYQFITLCLCSISSIQSMALLSTESIQSYYNVSPIPSASDFSCSLPYDARTHTIINLVLGSVTSISTAAMSSIALALVAAGGASSTSSESTDKWFRKGLVACGCACSIAALGATAVLSTAESWSAVSSLDRIINDCTTY